MQRRIEAGLVLGAFLVLSCQGKTPQFSAENEATLRAMFDSVVAEVNSSRWDAWAGHYSADAVLMPPNAPAVRGHDALLAWGKAFPPVESLSFSDVQVHGSGDMAWGTSAYALKLKDQPMDSGKQLVVFRPNESGKWEVVAASFNSDQPPVVPPVMINQP